MALSRRKLILMGAGAAIGVPAARHLSWAGNDFSGAKMPALKNVYTAGSRLSWKNWSGLQACAPQKIFVPKTIEELAGFVEKQEGRIRPVGSGHSFTALVPTEDSIVDVSRFSGIKSYDKAKQTVTVGAGSRLRSIARELDGLGLAFANMPDVDVQTMAGSFNTATHGAGLSLTAIHDYTIAFTMVTSQGEVLSVTRENNPELFAAGKVSLGALGIITDYTLKVEKAFKLHHRVIVEPIEVILDACFSRAERHHAYEFFYLPASGYGVSLINDITDAPIRKSKSDEDENQIIWDLKKARDLFGWAPSVRRRIIKTALPKGEVENQVDSSWRLLSTARPIKFNEIEYHIPLENADVVIREVIKRVDSRKDVFFPIEVRYVAQDKAWLSPFSEGPTMSIAIHALQGEKISFFFDEFEPLFRKYGGRPHWGKLHSLKGSDLMSLYPRFKDFEDIRTRMDPTGKFLNPHIRKLFGL